MAKQSKDKKASGPVEVVFSKRKRKKRAMTRNSGSKYDEIIKKIREECTEPGSFKILEVTSGKAVSARINVYTKLHKLDPYVWAIELQEDDNAFAVVRRSKEEQKEARKRSAKRKATRAANLEKAAKEEAKKATKKNDNDEDEDLDEDEDEDEEVNTDTDDFDEDDFDDDDDDEDDEDED